MRTRAAATEWAVQRYNMDAAPRGFKDAPRHAEASCCRYAARRNGLRARGMGGEPFPRHLRVPAVAASFRT